MKTFGQYVDDKIDCFTYEGYEVILQIVPLELFERHIIGVDKTDHNGMQKFRVEFRYPTSKNMAKGSGYKDFTKYLLAHSAQDAKDRVIEFIHNKPQPYLQQLNPKDMGIRIKTVVNWNDFIELANHIIEKRYPNPIKYFSQDDLNIFLNRAKKSKDFNMELQSLPKETQLFLKRIYLHTVNQDLSPQNRNILNEPGTYAKDVTRKHILDRSSKTLGKFFPTFKPKDINEEPSVGHGSTFYDVLKEAKLYGFTYKDLKNVKNQMVEMEFGDIHERQSAWRDIRERLKNANRQKYISSRNPMFHGQDHAELDKFGGDGWVSELIRWYPFLHHYNRNDNDYAAIYDFYKEGLPKLPPASQLWRNALLQLIDWKKQEREPQHDEIPF